MVKHINDLENNLKQIAETSRNIEIKSEDFLEDSLIKKLEQIKINGNICAIDAGLVSHRTHGLDILLFRTLSVNFFYSNSSLISCNYYPSRIPDTNIEIKSGLDEHESVVWRSLIRLKKEISASIDSIEKFSPLAVLIDGSILPLPSDRPSSDSTIFIDYQDLINLYKKLYLLCKEKNILLIGVIKDSRGKIFIDAISKKVQEIKNSWNDSMFLNYFLNERERTTIMRYGSNKQLKDLEEFTNNIYVSYLKVTKNDLPLRLEFLSFNNKFKESTSTVYSLAAISDNYAYPAILTEVDLCAMLDEREAETLKMLNDFNVSKSLRRNNRPFR